MSAIIIMDAAKTAPRIMAAVFIIAEEVRAEEAQAEEASAQAADAVIAVWKQFAKRMTVRLLSISFPSSASPKVRLDGLIVAARARNVNRRRGVRFHKSRRLFSNIRIEPVQKRHFPVKSVRPLLRCLLNFQAAGPPDFSLGKYIGMIYDTSCLYIVSIYPGGVGCRN